VAGVAAGNGIMSHGRHKGIAYEADLVAIKVLDEAGRGNATDALAGIQWVIDNHKKHNIRVANLSIGTMDVGSADPLVRAVEAAWDAGIVMVIAAGNNGPKKQSITSPGTSRKAITVGAADDQNFVDVGGSNMKNFSGRGPTSECIVKPDIVAPGCGIISCLTNSEELSETRLAKMKVVDEHYVQMSGTSMAAPRIAGAVALLLSKRPEMTPNEVKLALKKCAVDLRFSRNRQGWGMLDINGLLSN